MIKNVELLAPAGNVENFFAALEAGADAVYVGAPGFNARNLAKDIRLDEIGAMIRHCHDNGSKIYIAANSLILEKELPAVIDALAIFDYLQPDGLIVQDAGLINIIRRFFPDINIHGSTLMATHNLQGVQFLEKLGCQRVVLARELTLDEIGFISGNTDVELEIFVHGAMCFSYSGLCLFSSYLGGKSGLRGRCVQPCRRGYSSRTAGKKGSGRQEKAKYLFSMNDLEGLEAVHDLKNMGISSLKIEGRLRSANYVRKVVEAYRLMLDTPEEQQNLALKEARKLIEQGMSRKLSSGYFFQPQPAEAISPYHSGNLGHHLGRGSAPYTKGDELRLQLKLKGALERGDRLRLHLEPSGERVAFTIKQFRVKGQLQHEASQGQSVELLLPQEKLKFPIHQCDLYKVDGAEQKFEGKQASLATRKVHNDLKRIKKQAAGEIGDIRWKVWENSHKDKVEKTKKGPPAPKARGRRHHNRKASTNLNLPLEWWLKVSSVKTLLHNQILRPDRYLVPVTRNNVAQAGQLKRTLGKQMRNVTWTLPSVVLDKDIMRMKKQISSLLRGGFRSFQIGHMSQSLLFTGEKVFLSGDYSLNLLNNQSLLMAAEVGLETAQLAIEADRESLRQAIIGYKQLGVPPSRKTGGRREMKLGLTVYDTPALFTSRIDAQFFQYQRPLMSPKKESFVMAKNDGASQTMAVKPFSLLPYLYELKQMGLDYCVVDLGNANVSKKELEELPDRLAGQGRYGKLSTFNYLGKLE